MCTFLSSLPKKSKSNGTSQNKSLVLSLKPCPESDGKPTWYRVRLLAWSSPEKNDRDYPFIERFVHQIWKKSDKGYPMIDDEVTCPVTKHVHVEGNRYDSCPMCKVANQYFITWKSSNYTDREAIKKNNEIGRKYQAIIPVYVKDDPNYNGNNGKFKVLIFNDKKFYAEFVNKVNKASQTNCVFNGKNAVDCCLHVTEVSEVKNEGQPNEYVYKHKVIDKVSFTTKPYDIPTITKEWVTNSGFDEEYYTSSSPEELQAFYNRHFKISNDDIPDDDIIQVSDTKTVSETQHNTSTVTETLTNTEKSIDNDISDSDIDDLTSDIDNEQLKVPETPKSPVEDKPTDNSDTESVDDLLKGLDL